MDINTFDNSNLDTNFDDKKVSENTNFNDFSIKNVSIFIKHILICINESNNINIEEISKLYNSHDLTHDKLDIWTLVKKIDFLIPFLENLKLGIRSRNVGNNLILYINILCDITRNIDSIEWVFTKLENVLSLLLSSLNNNKSVLPSNLLETINNKPECFDSYYYLKVLFEIKNSELSELIDQPILDNFNNLLTWLNKLLSDDYDKKWKSKIHWKNFYSLLDENLEFRFIIWSYVNLIHELSLALPSIEKEVMTFSDKLTIKKEEIETIEEERRLIEISKDKLYNNSFIKRRIDKITSEPKRELLKKIFLENLFFFTKKNHFKYIGLVDYILLQDYETIINLNSYIWSFSSDIDLVSNPNLILFLFKNDLQHLVWKLSYKNLNFIYDLFILWLEIKEIKIIIERNKLKELKKIYKELIKIEGKYFNLMWMTCWIINDKVEKILKTRN